MAVTLLPGEIIPELILGGEYGDASLENQNPEPLCQIAAKYAIEKMLVVGLVNDEIEYRSAIKFSAKSGHALLGDDDGL